MLQLRLNIHREPLEYLVTDLSTSWVSVCVYVSLTRIGVLKLIQIELCRYRFYQQANRVYRVEEDFLQVCSSISVIDDIF